jgi:hypothetical protein
MKHNSPQVGDEIVSEDAYRKLMRRVHPYRFPPEGFDVRTAPNHKLSEYGLLERPDERLEPERFAFWKEMFCRDFKIARLSISTELTAELKASLIAAPQRKPAPRVRFDHTEHSANWSGAYITPIPRPNRFVQIVGAFTVPRASVPPVLPEGADPTNQAYHSSTWIGIGGHRSYNTLPQIGTSQQVNVKGGVESVEYKAWWQWWQRDDEFSHVPKPIPIAGGFEVREGDGILVSITVEAPRPGDVHFIIMNLRTGVLVPFKVMGPAGIQRLGSTAEWVHERPSEPGSRYRYPLPNFTEVTFRHCLAWSAPCFGAPATLQALASNVRLLRMKDIFPTPHRSAIVSLPKRTSRTSLQVNYRE